MPSNSLAVMYGLAINSAQRRILGLDVTIDVNVIDETNTRVNLAKLIRRFRLRHNFGLVALVGVQSNQYPRALDIALPLRKAGIQVVIGGFHVSGCLAMLDGSAIDLDIARDLGVSIFAGEAEGHLDMILLDAARNQLKPVYTYVRDLASLDGAPTPFLPREVVRRTVRASTSFDAGRGCPFQCSFCTIINVQGRKSRSRTPAEIEQIVRENWKCGIRRFFITDDNFARNKQWEAIFDRLAKLKEVDGIPLGLMIQVDTMCHKISKFIEKAKRAGVTRVFIGLESINPRNLAATKKKHNKVTEYRRMLLAWKAQGIFTYAGYILGFPEDTPESIRRDIEIIQRELPLDFLEFTILTPLPGSADHKRLWANGTALDPDLNKYDLEHIVMDHPRMSRSKVQATYEEAWKLYYTREHIETLLRRAAATNIPMFSFTKVMVQFATMVPLEKLHPLQSGFFRVTHHTERRPGLPQESVLTFYPRLLRDLLVRYANYIAIAWWIFELKRRIGRDPHRHLYRDQALRILAPEDEPALDLHDQGGSLGVR
jgi:radical SAM superfamily enzyme YgiQ (UPF0313 family)